eukprot:TRINITY_DN14576_c0_g1_i14.p1 TRINITY_DN14576_c0_g1~~TRINITY_DN14576_c0_g1_i14.p1  ORF type:complete len:211 (-),score=39.36 TRINITY_DN14576_c0_g1_i14:177-809(-)
MCIRDRYFMDSIGRRNMQLQGFLIMAILYAILGIFDHQLTQVPSLMLVLYGLTFFFSNFGPNSTTFQLPAESFPPQVRTTLNGLSAACGMSGAALGSAIFKTIESATSLPATMLLCAGVSLLGFAVTWFFVVDMRGKPMEGDEETEETPDKTSDNEGETYMSVDPAGVLLPKLAADPGKKVGTPKRDSQGHDSRDRAMQYDTVQSVHAKI